MTYTRLQQVKKKRSEKFLRTIHRKAIEATERLKSCEADLIRCLQEVDDNLVHRFLGFNSLYQYALHALRLSESQAAAYISVARKSKEFPALGKALESGELTVSKAARITSVINERSQSKWVELAQALSKRDLERQIAQVSPRAVVHERARFLNETTLEMSLPISEEGYKEIERLRDLLASEKLKPVSLEETLLEAVRFYLDRKDPVKKAARALARQPQSSFKNSSDEKLVVAREADPPQAPEAVVQKSEAADAFLTSLPGHGKNLSTKSIPALIRHQVHLRDQGRFRYRFANGEFCGERKWTELHHVQPQSEGGLHLVHNLVTLCKAHHQFMHQHNYKEDQTHELTH